MSWVAVIATAAQAGYGIYQHQKGKEMEEQAGERPEYEIPSAAQEALGTAQLRSLQGMPDAVRSQMLQEMDRSRMASLRQVGERRGGLGAVTQLELQQQDAIRKIGAMDIEARERNIAALQQQRGIMAGYQETQQADTLQAWEQESQAAAAMKGAGIQNIGGAAISAASLGVSAGGADSNIFSGKKREAYKLSGGKEGTGMSFKEFRKAPLGGEIGKSAGYADFLQNNPNFFQQRIVGGDMSQPDPVNPLNTNFAPVVSNENKIDVSAIDNTNTNQSSNLYSQSRSGILGFNRPFGYNQGITSNLQLSTAMDRYDMTYGAPSITRQLGGLNLQGGGQNTGPGMNVYRFGINWGQGS
jgi:hypothetical protein